MTKQKSFKELYKELEKTRHKIEEQQQHEGEIQGQLREEADSVFLKILHEKYTSDVELFELINALQGGMVELKFISTVSSENEYTQPDFEGGEHDGFD